MTRSKIAMVFFRGKSTFMTVGYESFPNYGDPDGELLTFSRMKFDNIEYQCNLLQRFVIVGW